MKYAHQFAGVTETCMSTQTLMTTKRNHILIGWDNIDLIMLPRVNLDNMLWQISMKKIVTLVVLGIINCESSDFGLRWLCDVYIFFILGTFSFCDLVGVWNCIFDEAHMNALARRWNGTKSFQTDQGVKG